MSAEHHHAAGSHERHRVEGPKNHFLGYIISIVLTMLAFAAVIYGGMSKMFLVAFLTILAIAQAVIQLAIWMHMKDRGHRYPILFLAFGGFVAATAAIAAVYWMWW